MEQYKVCKRCKKQLNIKMFYSKQKDALGNIIRYSNRCKKCDNIVRKNKKYNRKNKNNNNKNIIDLPKNHQFILLVNALLELSRYDEKRLLEITEKEFKQKTNTFDIIDNFNYEEIHNEAINKLYNLGHHHPDICELNKSGYYLIVGDSHGKHTKTKLFNLLHNLNNYFKFNNIIHIGHILDDDNTISYHWKDFSNLIICAKAEELPSIENNNLNYQFDIVKKRIKISEVDVFNQELITDYTKTPIDNIPLNVCKSNYSIVNCHRHELFPRLLYNSVGYINSPGSLCEKHIVKTIKQIDFTNGYQIKQAYWYGFNKYRRMEQMFEFWEQGATIVHVDKEGDTTLYPINIKKIDNDYVTSLFDKIFIDKNKIINPDKKHLVIADVHAPSHDIDSLNIINKIVNKYKPDTTINLGDMYNNESLNHHKIDRNQPIYNIDILDEYGTVDNILERMSKWSNKNYFIVGNHERFIQDFYNRYPQLQRLFTNMMTSSLTKYNYDIIELGDALNLKDIYCVHGDIKMYGQKGSLFLDKLSNSFNDGSVIVGHMHFTGIRQNVFSIGMLGKKNQEYNEKHFSRWNHGFGIINEYKGISFVTPLTINNKKFIWNEDIIESDDKKYEWDRCNIHSIKISYQ